MDDLLGTRIVRETADDAGAAPDAGPGPAGGSPASDSPTGIATAEAGADTRPVGDSDRPASGDDVPGAVAFVYVPVRPRKPGDDPNRVMFELRSIDGEPGLAVYTQRERLIAELGEHQPHVGIPVLHLLVRLGPERLPIAVDPTLEPGAERWTEESIRRWQTATEV